jgi:predicted GNAT family N-acyltransferase
MTTIMVRRVSRVYPALPQMEGAIGRIVGSTDVRGQGTGSRVLLGQKLSVSGMGRKFRTHGQSDSETGISSVSAIPVALAAG